MKWLRYFAGGYHGSLVGETGGRRYSELSQPLDMLADVVASALAPADLETDLDLSTAARHVSEVVLGIEVVAILVDFAQNLERTAPSRIQVHSRLVGTALLGENEESGVERAHLELEPDGGEE